MAKSTERTSFTKDVQGRYLCNDLTEVNAWKNSGGRPFDVLVIGGGTFGAAIAEHIWFRQKKTGGGLRTLVIEAGLFTIPEHVQNTGIQGLTDPFTPFNLNENAPQPEPPRNEVWGIPWKSSIPFKGLAYTIGGRSVYWGGWSPQLLDEEVTTWPAQTVADLKTRYFGESTRQIGVDETNDFIFGELHTALRQRLFDNLGAVTAAIPLNELPPSPLLKGGEQQADLLRMLGLDSAGALTMGDLRNLLKVEAPLGVQARPPHAGFFPLNKFSTVPLLMKAARTAVSDSNGDDAKKEFMILPDTHVLSVRKAQTATGAWRVTGVDTSNGFIELAPGGVAVIALGTLESARLALVSFDGTNIPTLPLMGKNLIAHVRSNLVFRVPRAAIPGLSPTTNELQTSALFVKGRFTAPNGDVLGHFHLQITASGGGSNVGSEDELFRKVPDVDFYEQLRSSSDTDVAIAIRGIGEIAAADFNNLAAHPSRVDLDSATDEYGIRRALVTLTATQRDNDLWTAMDAAMTQVMNVFANGQPIQLIQANASGGPAHDGLGTTHAGFEALFDGQTMGDWRMSSIRNQPGRDNPGSFLIRRGAFEAHPGTDLGMLWLTRPSPARYVLRLEWMMTAPDDNSGVFVAFPDPEQQNYDNTAYVGINFGFEIQIDELARPDNALIHRTGAIYSFKGPTDGPLIVHPVGEWNAYEITVDPPDFTVALNGQVVNQFHFTGDPQSPQRGLASTPLQPRFIGLQTHTGQVLFRRIQWKAL